MIITFKLANYKIESYYFSKKNSEKIFIPLSLANDFLDILIKLFII